MCRLAWANKSTTIAVIKVEPTGKAFFKAACRPGLWVNTIENDPLA